MPCQDGNQRQKWKRDAKVGYIRSGVNGNNVFDIYRQYFTLTMHNNASDTTNCRCYNNNNY